MSDGLQAGEGVLRCGHCDSMNLHHVRVDLFDREEDASQGIHVRAENGAVTCDRDLSGNPSLRRHGVSVRLACEHCNGFTMFSLSQHKGETQWKLAAGSAPA